MGALRHQRHHAWQRVDREQTHSGRFKLNLPTIAMGTIGAGAGTAIKVDPLTKKVSLGPKSAGASPDRWRSGWGVPNRRSATVTRSWVGSTDCFLGGKVKLDIEGAERVLQEKVADPLGIDVYEAAEGMANLLEMDAKEAIRQMVSARAVDPSEYSLMAYGGSGPLHMAEYSRGLGFKNVLTFPFAAAFSAFGCTTADYLRRYSRSVQLTIPPEASAEHRRQVIEGIDAVWDALADAARREMAEEGHDPSAVQLEMFAMMRYTGQLWFASKLVAEGLVDPPPLFQLCMDIPYGAPADSLHLQAMVNRLPEGAQWAAFALGRMQMPWVAQSVLLGGHVRVGLEDNLYLSKGVKATNEQLVARAVELIHNLGSRVAMPDEAREILNLKPR
ncbi:MAG: 3-keto-5-aminohexanoate cleavage protein [Saccharomonospora viridis]|uniref:3-keto-5-aminohexanoate cleavage protein n=1 Tax=Saccharomonospora viridis TaxID=1852 RepID=UPI003D91DB72